MNPEMLSLSELPSLPLRERKSLPVYPAIYFLLDGEKVLYIGKTQNLRRRWSAHFREKQAPENSRIAWLELEEVALLGRVEKIFIKYFNPSLNGVGSPHRSGERVSVQFDDENLLKRIEEMAIDEERPVSRQVLLLAKAAVELIDEQGFHLVGGKLRRGTFEDLDTNED
jgi:hypothetical protein